MLYFMVARHDTRGESPLLNFLLSATTSDKTIKFFREAVDVSPVVGDQWSYANEPQAIFVEELLFDKNPEIVKRLRSSYKQSSIFVESADESLEFLQNCLAAGATNVFTLREGEETVLRKVVLGLEQVRPQRKASLVVVDGSKGGIGVTTFVASLGAALSDSGKNVLLMDLDYESQDLARFLAVRPFMNENLELLFAGSTRPSIESVTKSCSLVWSDRSLKVASPAARYENLLKGDRVVWNKLKTFLEIASSQHDVIIIDSAGLPSYVAVKLFELAETSICLVGLNPTAVHAALARLRAMLGGREDFFNVWLVPVRGVNNVHLDEVQSEFAKQVILENAKWSSFIVPFDRRLQVWPGSSHNPVQYASATFRSTIQNLAQELELVSDSPTKVTWSGKVNAKLPPVKELKSLFSKSAKRPILAVDPERKLLPAGETTPLVKSDAEELVSGVKFISV